jgi:hypothetical protein
MIASLVAAMLSSTSVPIAYILPKPVPKGCGDDCASRYRLPASSGDGMTIKDRAMRDDGSKCNVVGARRCTSKPRRILRAAY